MMGLILLLAGCGGGDGGGGGGGVNTAPIADAGSDRNVLKNTVVRLDAGSSSDADNDALTYSWAITSKPTGSNATLSGAIAVNPTFTADARGVYALSLVVNDGQVDSAPDFVTIQTKVFPGEKFAAGNRPRSVFVADLDGDGFEDLVTANEDSDNVSMLRAQ